MSYLNDDAVPIGFGMALAQNVNAMKEFSGLTEAEKEEILNRARDAKSREDMEALACKWRKYANSHELEEE